MANFDVNVDFNIGEAQRDAERFADSLEDIEQQAESASGGMVNFKEIATGALRAVGEMALQSAIAGLQALADQTVQSVQKFAEFESSQQKLQQSLERTGRSAEDFAKAQNTIRESAELLGQSQAELSQIYNRAVTLIGDSSVDVDRAFELARNSAFAFGEDFENTMDIVAEAVKDPESAMEAFTTIGVQFTNEQKNALKSLVESGKEAEATAYAFEILENQVGNNVDANQTLQGSLNALTARVERLQLKIGEALAPVVTAIVKKFSEFFDELSKNERMSIKLEDAIQKLATYIENIDINETIEAFEKFWNVMSNLGSALLQVYRVLNQIGQYTPQGALLKKAFDSLGQGGEYPSQETFSGQGGEYPEVRSNQQLPPVNDISKKIQQSNQATQTKVTYEALLKLFEFFKVDSPTGQEKEKTDLVKYLLSRPDIYSQIEQLVYSPVMGENAIVNGKMVKLKPSSYQQLKGKLHISETSRGEGSNLLPTFQQQETPIKKETIEELFTDIFGSWGNAPFLNGLNFGNGFLSMTDKIGVFANGFDVVGSNYKFGQREKNIFGDDGLSAFDITSQYIESITPKLESAESAFFKVADSVLEMTGALDANSLAIKLNDDQISQQIKIINQYQQVVSVAENALTNFAVSAISNFQSVGSAFGQLAQQILTILANQAFSNIFGGLLGGLIPSFNNGIGGIGTVGTSVFNASNFGLFPSTFGTGGVSFFADGGVVHSPTKAIIGEAGSEAVVPLPDGRSIPVMMQGGGGDINITVNVQGGGEQNGQRLGRQISQAIKAELINQKRTGGILS